MSFENKPATEEISVSNLFADFFEKVIDSDLTTDDVEMQDENNSSP